jgi:hypothetical protein
VSDRDRRAAQLVVLAAIAGGSVAVGVLVYLLARALGF